MKVRTVSEDGPSENSNSDKRMNQYQQSDAGHEQSR